MTIATPTTLSIPFRKDEHGTIRVSGTRVTLDTLMACYLQGDTPEGIHAGFPTVALADIYAVIAYYLAHQAEVDAYLHEQQAEGERIRQAVEANYTPAQRANLERLRQRIQESHEAGQAE